MTAFYWGCVCVPQANNTSSVEYIVDCTHFLYICVCGALLLLRGVKRWVFDQI